MKWALVLSGGGAKGYAHIAVIRAIEQKNAPLPSFIAGTSMGSIIGALYALGWTASQMEEYVKNFEYIEHVDSASFRLPSFFLSKIVQAGTAFGSILKKTAIDSGERIYAELKTIFGDTKIEDLKIKFSCVATDLLSGKAVVFDKGPVVDALRASISYPGLFSPFKLDKYFLADGGIINNMPCDIAHKAGYHKILASDVSHFETYNQEDFENGIDVLFRSFSISAEATQGPIKGLATFTVEPCERFSTFDFAKALEIIYNADEIMEQYSEELEDFFSGKILRFIMNRIRKSRIKLQSLPFDSE